MENVPVDFDDLLEALEWVSVDKIAGDTAAYINRETGAIYWCGEGIDEDPPEDIDDGTLYVAVPDKNELDLGSSLVFRFVEEHLPDSEDAVNQYFRKRGAYSRFKALLERAGQLEAWHRYEEVAKEKALEEWCAENGFVVVRKARGS